MSHLTWIYNDSKFTFFLLFGSLEFKIRPEKKIPVFQIIDFLQNGDRHSLSQCEKIPHFGGIYRPGSYSNTMPMCSIWLQYHPPPGKGTAVKITGQEKEDKVKKSRHHMEFVNKSSDVFLIGQE